MAAGARERDEGKVRKTVEAEVERTQAAVRTILIEGLPPMPYHMVRLTALLTARPVNLKKVAVLIHSDRKLEEHLLWLTNSVLYGARQQVERTEEAAILIGTQRLRSLVFACYLMQLTGDRLGEAGLRQFWLHSLATAMLAERLARAAGYQAVERCYYSGLMHDVGKLAFLLASSDIEEDLWHTDGGDDERTLLRERQRFGFDHCQAGRWLALHWKLDLELIEVIGCHHQPENAQRDPALVGMIAAADHLCLTAEAGLPLAATDNFYAACLPWLLPKELEELISLLGCEYPLLRQQIELPATLPLQSLSAESASREQPLDNGNRLPE